MRPVAIVAPPLCPVAGVVARERPPWQALEQVQADCPQEPARRGPAQAWQVPQQPRAEDLEAEELFRRPAALPRHRR